MNHPPFFRSNLLLLLSAMMGTSNLRAQIDPETGTGIVNGFYFGPGVTYSNATFSFWELADADLSGSTFISCNFIGANLKGANFSRASLVNCLMKNANLESSNWDQSFLSNVDLAGASLANCRAFEVGVGGALTMPIGWMAGPEVNIDTHGEFAYSYVFAGPEADLSNRDLTGYGLSGANLEGAKLAGADLTGVYAGDVSGTPASLPEGWVLRNGYFFGPGTTPLRCLRSGLTVVGTTTANLDGIDLSGLDLSGSNFIYVSLQGANLSGADLSGSYLQGTDLDSANLSDTDLSLVDFDATTSLFGAKFRGAYFYLTDIDAVNLSSADLYMANMAGGIIGTPSALPDGWFRLRRKSDIPQLQSYGYLAGPGVAWERRDYYPFPDLSSGILNGKDLSGAILTGLHFLDEDFSGVNLSGALITDTTFRNVTFEQATLSSAKLENVDLGLSDLSGVDLSGVEARSISAISATLPTNWSLHKGFLVGPKAYLPGADLSAIEVSEADLSDLYLVGGSLAGATLSGCQLAGANLSNVDLRQAQLDNTDLTGARLEGALLQGVRSGGVAGLANSFPSGWKLSGGYLLGPDADLTGGDLSEANLQDVDLRNANLSSVRSGGIIGAPTALPSGWSLVGGYLFGPSADLAESDLRGLQLVDLDLSGASLSGANLSSSTLTNLDLSGASLDSAQLTGVTTAGLSGTPLSLPTSWSLTRGHLIGPGASLVEADISGVNLANRDLSGIDFSGADLGAAVLTNSNLANTRFEGVDFSLCALTGVKSGGILVAPSALPEGWHFRSGYLIGPSANLRNADLTEVAMTDFDLRGTNLEGAILNGVRSARVTYDAATRLPVGWDIVNGYLVGANANLGGADLRNTSLAGLNLAGSNLLFADLSGSVLDGCNLEGAQLFQANLQNLRGSGIVGTPDSLPASWRLKEGYLLGPGVDLSSLIIDGGEVFTGSPEKPIVLTEAKLSGLEARNTHFWFNDLDGADLRDADLSGCGFAAVSLDGALLDGLSCVNVWVVQGYPFVDLPPGWRFVAREEGLNAFFFLYDRGHLLGPGADLSGADLSGLDLSGSDLAGAAFAGADLAGADLSGADLDGADLSQALGLDTTSFSGASLDDMRLPEGYAVVNGQVVGGNRPIPIPDFPSWAREQGLPETVDGTARSASGQPLLLHFAMDVAPSEAIPAERLPRMERDAASGRAVFRYAVPKADRGVTLIPEISASPAGPWQAASSAAQFVEESTEYHVYELTPSTGEKAFFRVRIE